MSAFLEAATAGFAKGCLMSGNPWAAKARALDRYRWRLLRERHGWFGSVLRFAREALGDWWFGWRARFRLADAVEPAGCDFLLLQPTPRVIALQRKRQFKEAMAKRGHRLVEVALQSPRVLLRERKFRRPPYPLPTRYFALAAHAEWLIECYRPRILLNDRNGSLYSPFLRLALNDRQCLLVHLAHATTIESSRRLGMNDYDYYFLFGKSSEEALRRRALRFGSSTVVLTGSHMVSEEFDLPATSPSLKTLLVLGVGPDKEKEEGYRDGYALVKNWAVDNPGYRVLVKSHPRSQVPLWREAAAKHANIEVLSAQTTLAESLAAASIVISFVSNAVIEAGLARRPVIHVNTGGYVDIFEQERFFEEGVRDSSLLGQRIEAIERNYAASISAAESFASFHLAGGVRGLERTVATLEALQSGIHLPDEVQALVMPAAGMNGAGE